MEIMKETPWSRIHGQNSVYKELHEIAGSGKPTGSVLKDKCSFGHDIHKRAKRTQPNPSPNSSCSRMSEMRREQEVPEAKVPVKERFDCPAKITSKEFAIIHCVKSGTLQNACSTRPRVVAIWVKNALMRIVMLKNSLAKGLERMVTKCSGDVEKSRQLGCEFQDMEPP